jgi:hypothetical protein
VDERRSGRDTMVDVTVFVEGGGDTNHLRAACREGLRTFLTKAGVTARPVIKARGSRDKAYESFCIAVSHGAQALLLVDSEALVSAAYQSGADKGEWKPWEHLRQRDNWSKPEGATDKDCHLMVVCMESWLMADRPGLQEFFGQGFKPNALWGFDLQGHIDPPVGWISAAHPPSGRRTNPTATTGHSAIQRTE